MSRVRGLLTLASPAYKGLLLARTVNRTFHDRRSKHGECWLLIPCSGTCLTDYKTARRLPLLSADPGGNLGGAAVF